MIFATDLDNTLIFSHKRISGLRNTFPCVEVYNGRPITYMTSPAVEKLKFLMSRITVIPVTTRSLEQFQRLDLFANSKFAILDNGGVILFNGIILKNWNRHVNKMLEDIDLKSVLTVFKNLPDISSKPKIVDKRFVFAKSRDVLRCKKILQNELDSNQFSLDFQGEKVYAIPRGITKGSALKFICENVMYNPSSVIAAGDSSLDISMLDYVDTALIPSDSALAQNHENGYARMGFGINVAESILDFVIEQSKNSY